MSCFWLPYRNYYDTTSEKNWIIDLKRKDAHTIMKIVCNQSDINVHGQLKILNELYAKYEIKNYGFDLFFIKKIISIKKYYDSTYLFISNRL